jgi:hypothetical protein
MKQIPDGSALLIIPVELPEVVLERIGKYIPDAGAIEIPCGKCGRKGWLGPNQQEVKMSQPETEIICAFCVLMEQGGYMGNVKHLGGTGSRIEHPAITCPKCGFISHNPYDVQEKYCGRCHQWHFDM